MVKRIDKYRILVPREGDMRVDAIIYADTRIKVEDEALEQLKNATKIPNVVKVLATPDIHSGYGVPIGAVVGVRDIIIPAAVGYDVNCGMRLLTTPLKQPDVNVKQLADSFRRDIPLGEGKTNIRLSRDELALVMRKGVPALKEIAHKRKDQYPWMYVRDDEIDEDIPRIEEQGSMDGDPAAVSDRAVSRGKDQLATLGGGNHFLEIQVVERIFDYRAAEFFGLFQNQIVVMIHSGSRGLGHQIGNDYMPLAANYARDKIPVKSLGFFEVNSPEGKRYIKAMHSAANFAFANRQMMAQLVRKNLRHYYGDIPIKLVYDVPHNMAKLERHNGEMLWVHRKGATRAFPPERMQGTPFSRIGQPVLIPGSMGTASYVLIGLPTAAESLFSVNHGAGRVMSRTAAAGKVRRRDGKVIKEGAISDERFRESMSHVYLICEDKHAIKEEAPDAYKDIDVVIDIVVGAGLAKPVAKMRPLAVLKG